MSADQVNLSGKVQRFASGFDSGSPNGISEMLEDDGGEYVHHSDYAALESRNAELEAKLAKIEDEAYSRGFDAAITYAENALENLQPGDDAYDTLDRATKAVASIIDPKRLLRSVPQ